MNVVCCVDHHFRFRAITYGFGSSHDARIYRNLNMRHLVESITDSNCFVFGDSAFRGFRNLYVLDENNAENEDTQIIYCVKR